MRPEFYPLQYTFLSQIGHREDFRARLAKLYEEWRRHMAEDFAAELAKKTHIPLATGERIFTKWGFREILEKRAAMILQP